MDMCVMNVCCWVSLQFDECKYLKFRCAYARVCVCVVFCCVGNLFDVLMCQFEKFDFYQLEEKPFIYFDFISWLSFVFDVGFSE